MKRLRILNLIIFSLFAFAIFYGCVAVIDTDKLEESIEVDVESRIISGGITVRDKTHLRKKPNIDSETVMELSFGIPFFILDKKSFIEKVPGRMRSFYWYKVVLTDKETFGWIISKEGREGDYWEEALKENDFAGLYYSVACDSCWGYGDYDAAEKLFNYILEKYPDRQIPVRDVIGDLVDEETGEDIDTVYVDATIGTFNRLAKLYEFKKEFGKSIEYYEKITEQKNAKRDDIVRAKWNIMLVYDKNIMEYKEKIVDYCYYIIKEFPNEELIGFEWNLWVDIEAANIIVETFSSNENIHNLMRESRKILSESTNPPVILIATRGIVKSQIHNGQYELAKATLLEVMKKYPKEIRTYYMTPVNFTIWPLAGAIETIISEYGDYTEAIELAKEAKNSMQEKEAINSINYIIAQLLDEGDGNREEVLSYYGELSDGRAWDPLSKREIFPRDIRQRIEQIKIFEPKKMVISKNTKIKSGLRSKPQSYENISKGTHVEMIYKDSKIVEIDGKEGTWAKVKLGDGRIGWIFDRFLSKRR